MIESKLYQVEQPKELDELCSQPPQPDNMSEVSRTVLGVFVGGRYTFYHHMSDLLRIVNGYHVTESDVDELLRIASIIKRELESRKEEILSIAWQPQEARVGQPITSDEIQGIQLSPQLASFANKVLTMLAAKPFAIMYGPLKQHGLLSYLKSKESK